MYQIGDYIVYRKDVVKIVNIRDNPLNGQKYYVLVPLDDDSLKIETPVDNHLGIIRNIITQEEVDKLLQKIPQIPIIKDNKLIENDYKELLKEGSFESLVKIIKTTYLRNREREENKKKKGDKDNYYFKLAEKYLYNEIAVSLGKNFDETKDYIIRAVARYDN